MIPGKGGGVIGGALGGLGGQQMRDYYGMQQFGQQQAMFHAAMQQQQVAYANRLRNEARTLAVAIPSIELAEYREERRKREAIDMAEFVRLARKAAKLERRARSVRYARQSLIVGYLASGAAFSLEALSQVPRTEIELSVTCLVAFIVCAIPASVLGINVLSNARR